MSKVVVGSIIAVVVVALVVGLGWYWITQPDVQTSPVTSSNDTTDKKTNESTADAQVITFTDDGFSPSLLTIKAGDTVTVKNRSQTSVQFSSDDHPTHREHPEMNMRVLQPGGEATFTIATAGSYPYHDHINDRFIGTIVVTD